jgi:hypothetical protein
MVQLTYEDIIRYGNQIVPMHVARDILSAKAGRKLSDRAITLKCAYGEIAPMGIYNNTQYFFRDQVEGLKVQRRSPRASRDPTLAA